LWAYICFVNRKQIMRQFFKFLFASFFGTMLAIFIGFFFMFIIIGAIAASGQEKVSVKSNTVLVPELAKPITERKLADPFAQFGINSSSDQLALTTITKTLAHAKDDDKIKGLFLDLTTFGGGRSSLEVVKEAIDDFKTSGKPIYAYGDYYTESTYYLASLADSVFMQPTGGLDFNGASMEMMFLRGMFDKLDIEPRVFKHGDFKSAGEPFSETKMSDSNRVQMKALMSSIYGHYINGLAETMGKDTAELRLVADSLQIRTPEDALKLGFVDGLIYRDQMLDILKNLTGADDIEDIETLSLNKYAQSMGPEIKKGVDDRVTVVYAVGNIIMGQGDDETIGAERISEALRKARLDEDVKAVVLRVNSGGGSALASDIILREMELIKEAGKTVVVSMGDVAASGGYYISCKADAIFAQPNTITGSIGVIGFIPGTQQFFENKMGITFDRIKTGKYADLANPNRPMGAGERAIIQNSLDRIYDDFITHVSTGREMSKERVDQLGRGRVWTGEQALKNGLVDELGGLNDAIAFAATQAGLEDYKLKELPKPVDPFEQIMKEIGGVKENIIKSEIGEEQFKIVKQIQWIKSFDEPMMLMPYFFY